MTSSRGVICLNLGRSFASPPSRPLSPPTSPPLPLALSLSPTPLSPLAFSQRERRGRITRGGEERMTGVRGTARSFCFEQLDGTIKVRSHELGVFQEFRRRGPREFRGRIESIVKIANPAANTSVTLIIDRIGARADGYVCAYVCTTIYSVYSRNVSSLLRSAIPVSNTIDTIKSNFNRTERRHRKSFNENSTGRSATFNILIGRDYFAPRDTPAAILICQQCLDRCSFTFFSQELRNR